MRLALKLFRGEPAISGFDWNFSPIHTSFPPFSTDVDPVLHGILLPLQPGHGVGHPVSGLPVLTLRPFETWSPFGSMALPFNLASTGNSPDRSTKSTRSHLNVLPQFVNTGFQVLFHSPPGVLFTFPSQYYALSVTKEYLALEGGPSDFPQGFSCLAVLWILPLPIVFMYGAFTLSGLPSQAVPLTNQLTYAVLNPSMHARWFGLFRVRSPLLPESMFLSLPPAT